MIDFFLQKEKDEAIDFQNEKQMENRKDIIETDKNEIKEKKEIQELDMEQKELKKDIIKKQKEYDILKKEIEENADKTIKLPKLTSKYLKWAETIIIFLHIFTSFWYIRMFGTETNNENIFFLNQRIKNIFEDVNDCKSRFDVIKGPHDMNIWIKECLLVTYLYRLINLA